MTSHYTDRKNEPWEMWVRFSDIHVWLRGAALTHIFTRWNELHQHIQIHYCIVTILVPLDVRTSVEMLRHQRGEKRRGEKGERNLSWETWLCNVGVQGTTHHWSTQPRSWNPNTGSLQRDEKQKNSASPERRLRTTGKHFWHFVGSQTKGAHLGGEKQNERRTSIPMRWDQL